VVQGTIDKQFAKRKL